jgi:hypothetical protein
MRVLVLYKEIASPWLELRAVIGTDSEPVTA